VTTGRTCIQRYFTRKHASNLARRNTADLLRILKWNEASGIKAFRITSKMFPHATNPEVRYSPDELPDAAEIRSNLRAVGDYAREHGHILSMHPPHFVSLASEREDVQERSIEELEHHTWIADQIGQCNLNWHVGRNASPDVARVFLRNWKRLSESCRQRSAIEIDDNANGWSVDRILRYIHAETGCRITFDLHHWRFFQEFDAEYEFRRCKETWAGAWQEVHVSSSRDPQFLEVTHHPYITEDIPAWITDDPKVYLLVEAGAKELAVLRYAQQRKIPLNPAFRNLP
jgi:UV DNA damage endonuclease